MLYSGELLKELCTHILIHIVIVPSYTHINNYFDLMVVNINVLYQIQYSSGTIMIYLIDYGIQPSATGDMIVTQRTSILIASIILM